MNRCPVCNSTFTTGNRYCLVDGTRLVPVEPEPPATLVMHETSAHRVRTKQNASPLPYVVIGVLATLLLAAGAYIWLSDTEPEPVHGGNSTANTVRTAGGSQGSVAQLLTPTPAPSPTLSAEMGVGVVGGWNGDWSTASGAHYSLRVTLYGDADNKLSGAIAWTLRRTPRPDKQASIGMSATERVTGRFDPTSRLVSLKGVSKDDPNGLLVMLDEYRLYLSSDGKLLTGRARNGGKWNGMVDLSR